MPIMAMPSQLTQNNLLSSTKQSKSPYIAAVRALTVPPVVGTPDMWHATLT